MEWSEQLRYYLQANGYLVGLLVSLVLLIVIDHADKESYVLCSVIVLFTDSWIEKFNGVVFVF